MVDTSQSSVSEMLTNAKCSQRISLLCQEHAYKCKVLTAHIIALPGTCLQMHSRFAVIAMVVEYSIEVALTAAAVKCIQEQGDANATQEVSGWVFKAVARRKTEAAVAVALADCFASTNANLTDALTARCWFGYSPTHTCCSMQQPTDSLYAHRYLVCLLAALYSNSLMPCVPAHSSMQQPTNAFSAYLSSTFLTDLSGHLSRLIDGSCLPCACLFPLNLTSMQPIYLYCSLAHTTSQPPPQHGNFPFRVAH
eukprot:1160939-Pelagomonas_calceolata.AAC.8